ncbi:MAG TPA: Fic family protein [Candidatus Krumholzibacteria bacterium]
MPLSPHVSEHFHRLYLIKGALASTAIEGNTLTEEEVSKHLDKKLDLPKSKEYLAREVDNILNACKKIGEEVLRGDNLDLTTSRIKQLNRLVLDGVPVEEGVSPGEIREGSVTVGRYLGAPAQDCDYLLNRLCDLLKDIQQRNELGPIPTAIVSAIIAHLYLAWIHPFGDGNGRTARLMEFQILLGSGVPTPVAHLLSNHYNQTRVEYARQLDQASRSGGDIIPFVTYAAQGLVDGLHEQVDLIHAHQLTVAWRDLVHFRFRDKDSPRHTRQRYLVLDLGQQGKPVPIVDIPKLTPRLAKAYATRSLRTLIRDVADVEKMGLIQSTPDGIRARYEIMSIFLFKRKASPTDGSARPIVL